MSIMATPPHATGVDNLTILAGTTGICPICKGTFETCRCRGGHTGSSIRPRAGLIGDMTEDDNQRGYERDETDTFHRLIHHLVADGDDRARATGRNVRRTLAEMAPGYERQPVLILHRPAMADGTNCPPSAASTPVRMASVRAAVSA
ncbi:hypothetical protein ACFYXM_34145 [Streptomyces sp. NPDC002476]|uniref:hypothetical protein n=1 Tax=Streptomyces sp. NPDC002476 TaxID=3364648 RepID=UPI0036A721D8